MKLDIKVWGKRKKKRKKKEKKEKDELKQ